MNNYKFHLNQVADPAKKAEMQNYVGKQVTGVDAENGQQFVGKLKKIEDDRFIITEASTGAERTTSTFALTEEPRKTDGEGNSPEKTSEEASTDLHEEKVAELHGKGKDVVNTNMPTGSEGRDVFLKTQETNPSDTKSDSSKADKENLRTQDVNASNRKSDSAKTDMKDMRTQDKNPGKTK